MGNCPTCSPDSTIKNLDPKCYDERLWPIFLLVSFGILIIGWIILILFYSCQFASRRWKMLRQSSANQIEDIHDGSHLLEDIKEWGNNVISGQTKMGKTCVTINFLCCIASLILYCIHTTHYTYVESCVGLHQSILLQIDVVLNLVFLVYFFLRFTAAHNKRQFWLSLYSLVDIFTIPSTLVGVYLNRTWIGLRCLRALPLMDVPDILQYMEVIKRPRTIRLVQLASKFIAVWFAAAGIVHLLENSGDFFCGYCNGQEIDLFNSVYFMIITMATVGYGDFSCKTYTGKTFVLICLMGGLAVFATMFPEFANLFASGSPYSGHYQLVKGKRHVIICGHITPHSLALFLHDFLHRGREEVDDMEVVILDRKIPDIEMEALLKRYHTKLEYFVGSVMNIDDLKRVQINKARACLIIANKECPDPASDDSANIMRVISLKNFNNRIRILIQLLQYQNKLNVASIPGWNNNTDEIICIDELKLGFIGMSCVVPGFATMMTNIFRMSSYSEQVSQKPSGLCIRADMNSDERALIWSWRTLYHRGAGFTVFLVDLPSCFHGKSFAESALICFKLHVMLLAIEVARIDENGNHRIIVDVVPCDNCFVLPGSRAFLMCMSTDDVNRVKYYCSICYPNLDDLTDSQLEKMEKCSHAEIEDSQPNSIHRSKLKSHSIILLSDNEANRPLITSESERTFSPCWNRSNTLSTENITSFDSTGMFYYTSPRKIDDAILNPDLLREHRSSPFQQCTGQDDTMLSTHPFHFQDHIIVCIHADKSSPMIGLRNFVMPLRASSFSRHELSTIIFVTDRCYISKEWDMLSTFPDIYILDGSPTNPYNLKLISVQNCRQCVIMSTLDRGNLETYLVDKSSILCALTVRQIEMKWNESLLNSNGIEADAIHKRKNSIRTLTALTIDSNVQYVEQGHTDEVDLDFFLTTPFASGSAFADSVLDCILSCAYYNYNTINLLRIILMGGIDQELEEILTEGERFEQGFDSTMLRKRKRARIAIIPIFDLIPNIGTRDKPVTYDTLFCQALKRYHIVVLGIYRLLNVLVQQSSIEKPESVIDDNKRIVIYYPPHDYQMDATDMVYVMQHSHLQDN